MQRRAILTKKRIIFKFFKILILDGEFKNLDTRNLFLMKILCNITRNYTILLLLNSKRYRANLFFRKYWTDIMRDEKFLN